MIEVKGTAVVRRLRKGGTINTRLDWDKDLYQGISDGGWVVNPDWTVAASQPTITPVITSSIKAGLLVIVPGSAVWVYNEETLVFGGDGICTGSTSGSTGQGKFKLNPTTGALTIIDNLASQSNTNVDSLRFRAVCNVGYETPVGASVDVRIELVGKNSYTGVVDTTSKTLKETVTDTITATSRLTLGIVAVSSYKTEWLKGQTVFKAKSTDKTCSITRADVNASQVFVCNFYVTIDGADKLVSSYQFVIYDSSDPYEVEAVPLGSTYVDEDSPTSEWKAVLRRKADNAVISGATWSHEAYNCRGKQIALSTAAGTTPEGNYKITIKLADSDRVEAGEAMENGDITFAFIANYNV